MPTNPDIFAPPTQEELEQVGAVPAKTQLSPTYRKDKEDSSVITQAQDLFAPPTEEELRGTSDNKNALFAPPSKEELDQVGASPDEYAAVKKTIERPFFDAPIYGTEETTDKELDAIAKKHGVSPEALKEISTYYGAVRESGKSPISEQVQSSLGRGVAMNFPQLAGKKQLPPNYREAVDDVRELADSKRSFTRAAVENFLPIGGVASLGAKGIARGLGKEAVEAGAKSLIKEGAVQGAAVGAASGLGGSREGQEIGSTLIGGTAGAVLGAGVPAAVEGITSRLTRRVGQEVSNPTEAKVAASFLKGERGDIEDGTRKILESRAKSEEDISKAIMQGSDIDQPTASRILTEQLDPESLAAKFDPSTEEGRLIRQRVLRNRPDEVRDLGVERATELELANQLVESRAVKFAEELGVPVKSLEEARAAIKSKSTEGSDALRQKYNLFTEEQAALEHINNSGLRLGRENNFGNKALNMGSDAQFVLRDIDERFQTPLEAVHRDMNSAYNRMSFARGAFRKGLNEVYEKNRSVDDAILKSDKIYQALDSGDLSKLSPEEAKAAEDFKKYFNTSLEYVNKVSGELDENIAPLNIPKRENYVPHMLLSPDELTRQVDIRMGEALQAAGRVLNKEVKSLTELSPRDFRQLAAESEPLRELIQSIQTLDAREVKTAADVMSRYSDIFHSRDGRISMDTVARAALERQGHIPDWMREKNLYKLASRWTDNTLKHLYLRRDMDKLNSIARRVEAAGGELEAEYIKNLVRDINGIRRGTMAEFTRNSKAKYLKSIDEFTKNKGPRAEAFGAAAKALPEIMSDLNKQIYPNLLGLSPRALIMNSTQLMTKTVPELGNAYGTGAVFRGTISALLNFEKYGKRVEQLGFQPADYVRKYSRATAEGIRRSALYSIPNETLNKLGDAAMFMYTKMDKLNRVIALATGDQMAADLAKGSKIARNSLNHMPGSVRRAVNTAKSQEEIANIIGSHLNASTQYNYNRISMSEWGRTMGPLFSTFSKWPTATAGEIVQEYRNRGAFQGSRRVAEKFVVPLALLQLVDTAMFGDEEDMTDRQKKVFSKTGLSQAAPIGNLKGIIQGDFFTPPAIDAILKGIVLPTLKNDEQGVMRGVDSAIQNFTPGSVYVRFLTDDLMTLIEGERPEGSTFIERTESGFKQLGK